ncbi:acetylornithine deacetylase domain protein [Burkholderia mallei]|nr:acetylornithine deacetylase domain protein [Burkholderia mallei]
MSIETSCLTHERLIGSANEEDEDADGAVASRTDMAGLRQRGERMQRSYSKTARPVFARRFAAQHPVRLLAGMRDTLRGAR